MTSDNANAPRFHVAQDLSSHVPEGVQYLKAYHKVVKFLSIDDLPTSLACNAYYVPDGPSILPLFDAFTVDINYAMRTAVLWVFQMTTSATHGGSRQGYMNIRKLVMKLRTQIKELSQLPSASKPLVQVRYLLVVPKGDSENLEWPFPLGWNESVTPVDHRGEVYCLEVPITRDGIPV